MQLSLLQNFKSYTTVLPHPAIRPMTAFLSWRSFPSSTLIHFHPTPPSSLPPPSPYPPQSFAPSRHFPSSNFPLLLPISRSIPLIHSPHSNHRNRFPFQWTVVCRISTPLSPHYVHFTRQTTTFHPYRLGSVSQATFFFVQNNKLGKTKRDNEKTEMLGGSPWNSLQAGSPKTIKKTLRSFRHTIHIHCYVIHCLPSLI